MADGFYAKPVRLTDDARQQARILASRQFQLRAAMCISSSCPLAILEDGYRGEPPVESLRGADLDSATNVSRRPRPTALACRREQLLDTIHLGLGLGLYEFPDSQSFQFQLQYAQAQTEDILSNLDDLVKNTIKKAPTRTKNFLIALRSLQQLAQGAQEKICEGRQLLARSN